MNRNRQDEFIKLVDSFNPDDNLKYRIQRKVEDEMKKQEYQEKHSQKKSTCRGRKVAIFSACLVTVMGITMAMPVMADNTSIFDNLVAKIQQRNEVNPTNDYAVKVTESTAILEETQSADDTQVVDTANYEHCIIPYVDSYYCDGNSLYITYGIKANAEDLAQCNCIFGGMDIKINGQSLDNGGKSTGLFTASSDELGLFVGKINVDVSNVENLEGARVDIDFRVNTAFDSINQDFNYDGLYYEDRTRVEDKYLDDVVSFGFDITETTPQLDVYEVNQTQDGNTLYSVTVSPANTQINLDCQDGYYIKLYDSTGKELLWDYDMDSDRFETPMIGATSITVGLYNDTQAEPVYSFEVPIERGFNTGLDVENGQCYVDVEPIYNPPQNEILPLVKEKAEEEFKDIPKVGEKSYEYSNDYNGFNLTIDGYTIADNFDGLQLDNNMSTDYVNEDGTLKEGYKAIIVDATITSTIETEQEFYRQFTLDSGASYSIFGGFNEPIAFDNYENYQKSSYVITLQPNETRNMKIGFIISEDALQLPIVCQLSGYCYGDDDAYTIRLQ